LALWLSAASHHFWNAPRKALFLSKVIWCKLTKLQTAFACLHVAKLLQVGMQGVVKKAARFSASFEQ